MSIEFHHGLGRCVLALIGLLGIGITTAPAAERLTKESTSPAQLAADVKEIFRRRCYECHGGSSTQAGIEVLRHDTLLSKQGLVPGKPDESKVYLSIIEPDESARMPQDQPGLSSQDINTVRQYILAGAPAFPADIAVPAEATRAAGQGVVGLNYVLKQIHRHVQSLSPSDRINTRYFSCNHLLAHGATRSELDLQRAALAKAINHLSRQPQLVKPEIIDGETGSIFAVNIHQLGWDKRPFRNVTAGKDEASPFNLFDLLLLEYPYAVVLEDSAEFDALVTDYLAPAGMVRPIPYLRSDWFCSVATQPPLYHDLLQLPFHIDELEKELGIDAASHIQERRVKRAGMAVSGVSRNNRAVERFEGPQGMYWKSIDYATSMGRENIFTNPMKLDGTGGEMVFRLPNGMHGYYVSTSKGERLDFAPTEIVTDKFAEDKVVRNGLACMRCHDQGVKDFRDDVRPSVENLPGSAGLDKREILAVYPIQSEMDDLLSQDRTRFLAAMEKLLGAPQVKDPLTTVSQRFLDAPLQLTAAAGELGLADANDLRGCFRQPTFTSLGLIPLVNRGVVRRDMWEDYFDQVVRNLGVGIPIVPLDGVIRRDYLPLGQGLNVTVASTKKNNVFAPGDELAFVVTNHGDRPVFIELLGRGTKGEIVSLIAAGTKLDAKSQTRFPPTGALRVQAALGKETVTLFASETQFAGATILRGRNIGDRAVHTFYQPRTDQGRAYLDQTAIKLVKHTLEIETK